MEKIICAAIWYQERPTQHYLPTNIDKGVVVCGLRHPHCIHTMKALSGLRTVTFASDGVGEHTQGFITSKNRFIDRKEALSIARAASQIIHDNYISQLHSEDLY